MIGRLEFLPSSASTIADFVDALTSMLLGLGAFVLVLIVVLILIFCVVYRTGRPAKRTFSPDHRSKSIALEIAWTLLPFVIFIGLFAWGASLYVDMRVAPSGSMDIWVVGKQWMWKFQHPDGHREIDELHIPINQP